MFTAPIPLYERTAKIADGLAFGDPRKAKEKLGDGSVVFTLARRIEVLGQCLPICVMQGLILPRKLAVGQFFFPHHDPSYVGQLVHANFAVMSSFVQQLYLGPVNHGCETARSYLLDGNNRVAWIATSDLAYSPVITSGATVAIPEFDRRY
jgi:hypothetical protein